MASSRWTSEAAGWADGAEQEAPAYKAYLERRWRPRPISWLRPAPLLESLNQVVDATLSDVINPRRQRWVAARRSAGVTDLTMSPVLKDPARFSFLLVGDTGEADESQYATIKPIVTAGQETAFMVIVSDVIYPAGDINQYVDAFYLPYEEYTQPIYALPGNHDWLDGLNGFMFHFCGAEPLPNVSYASTGLGIPGRLARLLWRASARPRRDLLCDYTSRRPPLDPPQPGPYWAIDAGPLRLVAIDTGVDGSLDRQQAQWLSAVSQGDQRKILLTGKPLIVNHKHEPGQIHYERNAHDFRSRSLIEPTVDDILRRPEHHYIATVGGDIHNYQRYRVKLPGAREMAYIVSGGGGAFLSATHTLPRIDSHPIGDSTLQEHEFRCYPLRGDSLFHYTRLAQKHGAAFASVGLLVALLLLAAAKVLWQATGDIQSLPGPGEATGGWDLAEIATLLTIAAGAGFALPIGVLGDLRRGFENGAKLAVTAGLVWAAAAATDLPPLWVIAGAVAVPLTHAIFRATRKLFTFLLVACGLLVLPWLLDGTVVADYTGQAFAGAAALCGVYLLKLYSWPSLLLSAVVAMWLGWLRVTSGLLLLLRSAAPALVIGVVIAVVGWYFGLAVTLAILLTFAAVAIVGFLGVSGLWAFPIISAAARLGEHFDAGWARKATPDEAARWLSINRLGGMAPARPSDAGDPPWLARRAFERMTRTSSLGRTAQSKFSELFDANDPPFFRSFLKVDVDGARRSVRITCHGVTGRVAHEADPPVEDWVVLSFDGTLIDEMPGAAPTPTG